MSQLLNGTLRLHPRLLSLKSSCSELFLLPINLGAHRGWRLSSLSALSSQKWNQKSAAGWPRNEDRITSSLVKEKRETTKLWSAGSKAVVNNSRPGTQKLLVKLNIFSWTYLTGAGWHLETPHAPPSPTGLLQGFYRLWIKLIKTVDSLTITLSLI